jgi:RimJ/RimL family protein N-acetyltransferase
MSSEPPSDRITLRPVEDGDLPIFFVFEQDPTAIHMAAFTAEDPSDRAAFDAHWARNRANTRNIMRTVLVDGEVAGSLAHFEMFDQPQVSYWLGREYWGRGIATAALAAFLKVVTLRPLYARAVKDNRASIRVLEKNGFVIVGEDTGYANGRGAEVEEVILRLE